MKKRLCRQALALVAVIVPAMIQAQARADGTDPAIATKTISTLLAESNTDIPEKSTCQGEFGQSGRPKVKDLLATQMAYLTAGKNTVRGSCKANQCKVVIKHAKGEDVSSATISFAVDGGKANISTLQCLITP